LVVEGKEAVDTQVNDTTSTCPGCRNTARLKGELVGKEHALTVERERLRELEERLQRWAGELADRSVAHDRNRAAHFIDPRALIRDFDEALGRATAAIMPVRDAAVSSVGTAASPQFSR
jgi:hypothetical protein